MEPHPRLLSWWRDEPSRPGRAALNDPDVQRLASELAPGSRLTDLGGVMSLNVRLEPAGLVLHVHQPFVSRRRLLAVQEVRRKLGVQGLVVPVPVSRGGSRVFRCGDRWAELEPYLPHERLAPAVESYAWLFRAMGVLHRALGRMEPAVPRPLVATYAPPASLRRWLRVTESAVARDPETLDLARWLRELVSRLQAQWVPASNLPVELVHGDVRLSNVCRSPEGQMVYLDFGFLASRPRIHELAYSLAFMALALGGHEAPEHFDWDIVRWLVGEYEAASGSRLTEAERRALAPYTASVPLYFAALDGFTEDPVGKLRGRLPFLHLSEWLLANPDAIRTTR